MTIQNPFSIRVIIHTKLSLIVYLARDCLISHYVVFRMAKPDLTMRKDFPRLGEDYFHDITVKPPKKCLGGGTRQNSHREQRPTRLNVKRVNVCANSRSSQLIEVEFSTIAALKYYARHISDVAFQSLIKSSHN